MHDVQMYDIDKRFTVCTNFSFILDRTICLYLFQDYGNLVVKIKLNYFFAFMQQTFKFVCIFQFI